MKTGLLLAVLLALPPGATTAQQPEPAPPEAVIPPPEEFNLCEPERRPELCTQQHDPVCAAVDTGIRCVTAPCDNVAWRTFSNGCLACAEGGVVGWRPGACAAE